MTLTPLPLSVSLELPAIQLYPSFGVFPSSPPPTTPIIQIREPNAEDKLIADIVRLGIGLARTYPKESAAFMLGFGLAALIDASRKS